jgi:hypothetical protein
MEVIVSSAPDVSVSVSGQPAIEIAMQTKVIETGSGLEKRIVELENRLSELEQSTILPL